MIFISAIVCGVFSLWAMANFRGSFYSCSNKTYDPHIFTVFKPEITTKKVWIDPGNNHFLAAYTETSPSPDFLSYQRSSSDTPVCVVTCAGGSTSTYCQNTLIWGYQVLKFIFLFPEKYIIDS